jgi:hypothetical protein
MSAGRCAGEQAAGRSETCRGAPAPPYLSCRPAFIVEAGHSLSCWDRLSALTQRGRPRALLLNDRGAPSRLPFRLSPKPERSAGEGAETVGGPSLPEPVRFLPPEASTFALDMTRDICLHYACDMCRPNTKGHQTSEHATTATQPAPTGSESKHDQSARLTAARLERWSQTNYKVREHFRRHFRYLTEAEASRASFKA